MSVRAGFRGRGYRLLGLAGLLLLGACGPAGETGGEAAATTSQKVYRWRMITTWPKNLPGLGAGPENLANRLREMSNGRLDIKVYGANELVGAFEVFDAVSQGSAQMGHGAAYYWRGKAPVAALFATIPFGMNAQEMNGWLHYGGGMELWRRLYAKFNLVPLAAGNSGAQMAGWFNKEINSLGDLEGLRMRIPGMGGEVLQRAGGLPVSLPGDQVFTSLQTGVIDATEWVGPYNDLALGLFNAAKYYYYPGWHEPGPTLEAMVNKDAWDSLPRDLQLMIETTARMVNEDMLSEFVARNNAALKTLLEEHDVQLRRLPDDVLERLHELSLDVVRESIGDDPLALEIYESYMGFLRDVSSYHEISEQAFLNVRSATLPEAE
ncbi:MAG: TRAP transporter substrate-binding protein [Pseudomonadota bacterium]